MIACPIIKTKLSRGQSVRVIATAMQGNGEKVKVSVAWDYALGPGAGNHAEAAKALAQKLDWSGTWVVGDLDETHFAFTRLPDVVTDIPGAAFVIPAVL